MPKGFFHSHSIVPGTNKHLKLLIFAEAYNELTVKSTAKSFSLGAIEGDKWRKGRGAFALMRRNWVLVVVEIAAINRLLTRYPTKE